MVMSAETIARRAAARKREKHLNSLISIADKVRVISADAEEIGVQIDGCNLSGHVDAVNKALEKMGFRPVRLTSNMLNKDSPTWAIDINTPAYCDPGSEAYHSM